MTFLGDDARETLTIAVVWRKPRKDYRNNTCVFVLHKPVSYRLCTSVDQYLRTTLNLSAAQPTPMEIGAVRVDVCLLRQEWT